MSTRFIVGIVACAALSLHLQVRAQSSSEVLRGTEITESALIDALTPATPMPAGVRTRSLRIGPASGTGPGAGSAPVATPRGKGVLITFETGSAELTDEGRAALDVVARAFNNERLSTLSFAIEGHADPRGDAESNLRLSQARAESVRDYLVSIKGVSADRLRAIGKGDRESLNTRNTISPENRRVTFVTQQN